ncbi:hypothetical protein QBC38DRAFT_201091 [Podospora fimiseda]|uniref:DOMON domain-containing protein n=1 Tax=Podospora fimiseda TaxID=252190 RepID=A0AAN7BXV6_9PEZI|nr:hypothetical protein QBC38DRAFT_201091 [Podospora fimiseda]
MISFLSLLLLFVPVAFSQPGYGQTSKYCAPSSGTQTPLCYFQYYISPTAPLFRIAIPSDATSSTAFDTVLQIISPTALGWVGFAWGGGMTGNPLTVVWPNGGSGQVTVSSRWANGRTLPTTYSSATYKTLSSSRNTTHWSVEVVCTGCSRWSGGSINTQGYGQFAWALSRTAVPQPSNPSSSFSIHSNVGMISEPLDYGKNPRDVFTAWINKRP